MTNPAEPAQARRHVAVYPAQLSGIPAVRWVPNTTACSTAALACGREQPAQQKIGGWCEVRAVQAPSPRSNRRYAQYRPAASATDTYLHATCSASKLEQRASTGGNGAFVRCSRPPSAPEVASRLRVLTRREEELPRLEDEVHEAVRCRRGAFRIDQTPFIRSCTSRGGSRRQKRRGGGDEGGVRGERLLSPPRAVGNWMHTMRGGSHVQESRAVARNTSSCSR